MNTDAVLPILPLTEYTIPLREYEGTRTIPMTLLADPTRIALTLDQLGICITEVCIEIMRNPQTQQSELRILTWPSGNVGGDPIIVTLAILPQE